MRLVVLTSNRFGTASLCLPYLHESQSCIVVGVVLSHNLSPGKGRYIRQKLAKVLRIGPLGALNGIRMRSWYRAPTADLLELCKRLGIPSFETDYTNSDNTVRLFHELSPDLGLSLGNGNISPRVFEAPKFGMINAHGERLPQYQNAQSVIWPIYHGEVTTGLTIHQVERKIDTGRILHRDEFPIIFRPRLEDTVRQTVEVTLARTPAAVRFVCENYERLARNATPQENGRSFTTPSIWQFWRMVRNNRHLYKQCAHVRLCASGL